MKNYIRNLLKYLSISLVFFAVPNFVLASTGGLSKAIERRISDMSIDEKVGQLFIVGFPHKYLTPDLEKFITTYKPGSYILFKRNILSIGQVEELNLELYRQSYKATRLPPLIAIDQEGGPVSRLPIYPAQPNALSIGQTQSPLLAEELGYQTGLFLRQVGFNMNLAPVLDVSDPFAQTFIGVRSFGSDPQIVAEIGTAYAKGLLRAEVVPTAKHFPGAGGVKGDPHLGIIKNNSSYENILNRDLRPYVNYTKLGDTIAVMLSHFIYRSLDPSEEPASFSKVITQTILREKLSYRGLVITDDLQMQGSKKLLRPELAALRALQSGADIVMLTWSFEDQKKAFQVVKVAIQNKELPIELVNQKLRRILIAKAFVNNSLKKHPEHRHRQLPILTSNEYSKIEMNILESNLRANFEQNLSTNGYPTVEQEGDHDSPVCVLSPSDDFIQSFRQTYKHQVNSLKISKETDYPKLKNWLRNNNCNFSLSTVTGHKTVAILKQLPNSEKRKMIVVNMAAPLLLSGKNDFYRVVQLYFNHAESGKKIAQHFEQLLRN